MNYLFYICKIVYVLFCLPRHQCQECGTLLALNTDDINQGEDVRREFSIIRSNSTSLVGWWKYNISIDTTLPRYSIDIQHDTVMLTIHNFTVGDNGEYGVNLRNTKCSPPTNILLEKPSKPTIPILRPTSPSTGKDNSSTMLIGIICGCLAVLIIALLAFGCVIASKRRKKTPTREGSNNVHIQERQPSFQPQGPVYDNHAGSNHGDASSEAIAGPVEYACVVKKAKRQTTKPQTEKGALIYADLDLLAEGSTRGKPTLNLDVGTTYVSIDLALTEQMKRSMLDD